MNRDKVKAFSNKKNSYKQLCKENVMSLICLKNGERARIVNINIDNDIKLRKLTALGIMPGFDIMVIQKFPAIVIQIGYTQVALDEEIASDIAVSL